MADTLDELVQSPSPGALVILYQLDLALFGGPTLYWSATPLPDGSSPSLDGQVYDVPAAPVFTEGFERSTQGAPARPTLRIGSGGNAAAALMQQYQDLIGATLRRIRTFDCFLDGGSSPDATQTFPPDVYRIARKSADNKVYCEWELRAAVDLEGVMLPKWQLVRYCQARYRVWNPDTEAFEYDTTDAACPYTGTAYFDEFDQPTTAANDRASKSLDCCKLRFGENAVLPFMGSPAAAKTR